MNHSLLSILYFVAFSHAIFLMVALWQRSNRHSAGKLLAVVVALLAYKLFEGGAIYSGLYSVLPHALDLMPAMVLLLGPVFYGYVIKVTGQKQFTLLAWFLHLLPWIIVWVLFNADGVFREAALKIAMWDRVVANAGAAFQLPGEIVLRLLAIKAHLTLYLYLCWKNLSYFTKAIDNLRSDNTKSVVTQLNVLTIAFILLEFIWVSLFLMQQYGGIGTLSYVSNAWLLFIAMIVMGLGYCGLQNPKIVFSHEERVLTESLTIKEPIDESQKNEKIKYIHSNLPDSTLDEIANEIEQALEVAKLYLKEKLTLTELAAHLSLKSHTISQVINQRMNTNFYKLINSYRVQHAISLLDNKTINWPIERIAIESGFGNRVTFNKAFKEQMHCTASEYKKNQKAVS